MNIISDFSDIARRMNRKSEPGIVPLATPFAVSVAVVPQAQTPAGVDQAKLDAAVKTLQRLGYTYTDGAEMWKPPIGAPAGNKIPRKMTAEEHAAFRAQFLTQKAEMEQHHFDKRAAVLGEGWL